MSAKVFGELPAHREVVGRGVCDLAWLLPGLRGHDSAFLNTLSHRTVQSQRARSEGKFSSPRYRGSPGPFSGGDRVLAVASSQVFNHRELKLATDRQEILREFLGSCDASALANFASAPVAGTCLRCFGPAVAACRSVRLEGHRH